MATLERPSTAAPDSTALWPQLTAVAAAFLLLLCVSMLVVHGRARADDPLRSPQLRARKEKLLANPNDEELKKQIRALDLQLRQRHFRQLAFNSSGAWLVLGAATLLFVAGHATRRARPSLPRPNPNVPAAEHHVAEARVARWAVSAAGVLVVLGLVAFTVNPTSPLPATPGQLDKLLASSAKAAPGSDAASAAEMHQNWPRFRGPDGDGRAPTNGAAVWDCRSGFAVLWKTEVPVPGFNSPIIWRDRIFLSGGTKDQQEVLCFMRPSGELLWRRPMPKTAGPARPGPEVPEQTGFAASSVATDGRRVYAIFATGDLGAFTFEGQLVWSKSFGVPRNPHGHASSLVTWEGRLFVQLDQGEAEQNMSKLYALEGPSGRIIWQHNRPVPASWATPLIIPSPGAPQVITLGVPWVIAYGAQDGTELWRVEALNNEVTPSPIFAGGLALAVSPNEKLFAIRPDGRGNTTKTHIAWTAEDNIPDISSPVSNGDLIFTLTTPGLLTCYDLKDGKKQWEQDLATECNASPSIIGDQLCILTAKGGIIALEAARAYKEIGRTSLDEPVFASPAFLGPEMIVRGNQHLFCLGSKPGLAQPN